MTTVSSPSTVVNPTESVHVAFVADGSLSFFCDFLEVSNNIAGRYPSNKKELTSIFTVVERIIVLVSSHSKQTI